MSKIHSKIDTTKSISLAVLGIAIALVIIQIILILITIISSRKEPQSISNPIEVQQQNIKKAYELITSQTVSDKK